MSRFPSPSHSRQHHGRIFTTVFLGLLFCQVGVCGWVGWSDGNAIFSLATSRGTLFCGSRDSSIHVYGNSEWRPERDQAHTDAAAGQFRPACPEFLMHRFL
eukprot:2092987-Rhodomonas_salina.2